MLKQRINFQNPDDIAELPFIHPDLLAVLAWVSCFCHEHNVKCVITSVVRTPNENARVKSTSTTHVDGRAFDVSLRLEHGWSFMLIKKFEEEVNELFESVGALVDKGRRLGLVSTPIVIHESKNDKGEPIGIDHAHLQVRP